MFGGPARAFPIAAEVLCLGCGCWASPVMSHHPTVAFAGSPGCTFAGQGWQHQHGTPWHFTSPPSSQSFPVETLSSVVVGWSGIARVSVGLIRIYDENDQIVAKYFVAE